MIVFLIFLVRQQEEGVGASFEGINRKLGMRVRLSQAVVVVHLPT